MTSCGDFNKQELSNLSEKRRKNWEETITISDVKNTIPLEREQLVESFTFIVKK